MINKALQNIKDCINAIGIKEIVRSYVFAIIFIVLMNSIGTTSPFKGQEVIMAICFVFFPFSVALYDLGMAFFFRGFSFSSSIIVWAVWWLFKTLFLFALAPFLGTIFIILVTFTNMSSKMILKYNESKES